MTTSHTDKQAKPAFRHVGENLYRRESSGVYYALVKRQGKQFRKSLKTTDPAIARRKLAEHRESVAVLVSHDAVTLTFETVAERWRSREAHALKASTALRRKHYLAGVEPFFKGLTLRNIKQAHCDRWVTERGPGISAETFNHELGVMRSVFGYAKSQDWILKNPAMGIKRKRVVTTEIVVPTREQYEQLIATIRQSDGRASSQAAAKDGADLVEMLAYSGCRKAEVLALRWADVSFERRTVRITGGEQGTKNHKARTAPMTPALFGLLSRLHTERSPKPTDCIAQIQSARKCLETACKKLGFPVFTHHDFRHFFITTCVELGMHDFEISKWVGHSDGGGLALKRYAHLRESHSAAQIQRVYFGTKPPENVVPLPPSSGASQSPANLSSNASPDVSPDVSAGVGT